MVRYYFKVALRNLLKNKATSFINILGLSVGMASSILILLYVQNEISFDRHNKNCSQIYRLVLERKTPEGISMDITTPPPLGPALEGYFPEVRSVRLLNIDNPTPLIRLGTNGYYEKQFYFADPEVLKIFTIPLLKGDSNTALRNPNTVLLTSKAAEKYFGKSDPIGKILTFNNYLNLEVTGVVENIPSNSTVNFDFLVSFSTLNGWLGKNFVENWQNNTCNTYLMLTGHSGARNISDQLPGFLAKYFDKSSNLNQIYLQPMKRIHLYSYEDYNLASNGDINFVYLLSAIAFFILIIACLNYIGLTTAQLLGRAKEISIRKLVGAERKQLTFQMLGEGSLLTLIALVVSLSMVAVFISHFGESLGMEIESDLIRNLKLFVVPIGIIVLFGLFSIVYPTLFLSSFRSLFEFKDHLNTFPSKISFRKTLVVAQFSLTIILITVTLVVYRELDFIQKKQLGFDSDHTIIVPIREGNLRKNPEPLKIELMRQTGIQQVGAAALLPGGPLGKTRFRAEGITDVGTMNMLWVDVDFIKTLKLELSAGRDFSKELATDANEAFIINDQAVRQLGWQNSSDAIGKTFELVGSKKGKVIGVVKDFNFTSLQYKIEPIVLHIWPWLNYIMIRTDDDNMASVLSRIKNIWREFDPNNPFEYSMLSENFSRYYDSMYRLKNISAFFTLIAIIIACLGLFTISLYDIQKRTKEIGVRKINGASDSEILALLNKDIAKWVMIAFIIALPIAYYAMHRWLESFAYKTELSWWIFALAGILALGIALLTVSWQSWKAATRNPVEALRYE